MKAGARRAAIAAAIGLLPIFAFAQDAAQDEAEQALEADDMQRDPPDAERAQGSQNPSEIKSKAEQALDSDDMQRNAPNEERVRNEAAGVEQDPTIQHDPPQAQESAPLTLPSVGGAISGPFFMYLLLGVLGICLVIVAVHLVRTYVPNRRAASKDNATDVEASPIVPAGEAAAPELDEIERLARAGRHADAIHLMLLRTLDLLRRRLGANWATSLTSREIVRRNELGPTDRRALKVLVGAVEISRFGGHGANEQIYRNCLDHYRLIGVDLRPAGA